MIRIFDAMKTLRDNGTLSYLWFGIWLALVTGASIEIYLELAGLLWSVAISINGLENFVQSTRGTWKESIVLVLGGVLFWWRVVKVVVLHGSPIPFGLKNIPGRQDSGRSGRPVVSGLIGDMDVYQNSYTGKFWFGAVFRYHPSSDKLMRTRLELLVAYLPFGMTFVVHESRLFLAKDDHEGRARRFRLVRDKYGATREQITEDRFRRDVSQSLKAIASHHQAGVKRIDGLNWHFLSGGAGYITDDFGYRLSFTFNVDEGTYEVRELGVGGDEHRTVGSVSELRHLAMNDLNPILVPYQE